MTRARSILSFFAAVLLTLGLVFGTAGTVHWVEGWLYVLVMTLAVASVTFDVFVRHPDLPAERQSAAKHAHRWDRALVPLISGIPFVSVVVAGLGRRFSWWAPYPAWTAGPAALAMLLGVLLTWWGMRANRFFSSHVRIQTDRGHAVVAAGPYAVIRHPGYAGSTLVTLAAPVLLDSGAATVLAVITAVLVVVRTGLEDRFLRRELPGYAEYAARVRWRLVPFGW